jgi:hypothetical protein
MSNNIYWNLARDLAHKHICELAKDGAKSWRLCVPVQQDDSDMILQNALDVADKRIQQLEDDNKRLRLFLESLENDQHDRVSGGVRDSITSLLANLGNIN